MSQIQIQKKKLTAREIMPVWMEYMDEVHRFKDTTQMFRRQYELGICFANGRSCLVGEAHGGHDYDHCEECSKASSNFITYRQKMPFKEEMFSYVYEPDYPKFDDVLERFVEHFNEVHVGEQR